MVTEDRFNQLMFILEKVMIKYDFRK